MFLVLALKVHGKRQVSEPQPQPFRRIPEGCGGTYRFDQSDMHHVGVDGCRSCLGVYFAIDDSRCFAAHIWAWVEPSNGKPGGLNVTDQEVSEKVRKEVVRRIDEERVRSNWPPVSLSADA